MDFVEHKIKSRDKSSVWFHFLVESTGAPNAKCKTCNKVLKTNGGSTKGLLTHIKLHNIKLEKGEKQESLPRNLKITNFASIKQEDSLEAVIARLTALDGLPFSTFLTSIELRKSLKARGLDLPRSRDAIRNKFMCFFHKCKDFMKKEIITMKSHNSKFSLSFDEWTSTANKRYINVIVHSPEKNYNIGLVRIKKSATALNCIAYLEERLEEFNLSLDEDIVGFTTDGASTMKKIGKIIVPKQQLCLAHGIHLALIDVFYKNSFIDVCTANESCIDSAEDGDSSICSDDSGDFICYLRKSENAITDRHNIKSLIEKVRKISKMFRKSPQKNEILQTYVKQDKGKELKLLLDCKTRWNTLFDMCQRFADLEIPVKKALIDLKCQSLSEKEFGLLKQIIKILNPIKITVEALCRRDMNLCKADAALSFMLKEISDVKCNISNEILTSLRNRIKERRTINSSLLNFLTNSKIKSEFDNDFAVNHLQEQIFELVSRFKTNAVPSHVTLDNEFNDDIPIEEDNGDITKKLNAAIEKCKSPIKSIRIVENIESAVHREIDLFMNEGVRGVYLQAAYNYLLSIQPTSVDCERCFSSAAYMGNKIRSKLSDETLDALIFLRNFLKQ